MNKSITFFCSLLILSLVACEDKDDLVIDSLAGTYTVEQLTYTFEGSKADSIVLINLGAITFEGCNQKDNPCPGIRTLASSEIVDFSFQASANRKAKNQIANLTFDTQIRSQDWTASYNILETGKKLVLSCTDCLPATRQSGKTFELRASRN